MDYILYVKWLRLIDKNNFYNKLFIREGFVYKYKKRIDRDK